MWEINEAAVRHLLEENRRHDLSPGTAAELAKAMGVSESYVSHLLAGRKRSQRRLLEISALLRVTDLRVIATTAAAVA